MYLQELKEKHSLSPGHRERFSKENLDSPKERIDN